MFFNLLKKIFVNESKNLLSVLSFVQQERMRQMKNIGKKDPALYEDRGGNIIPAQFDESPAFPSYTAKETEDQIIAKLKNKGDATQ